MPNITPIQIIFFLFAALAVISALFVITARHPVRSVLSLVITFFAMAGIWMLLEAEFLSLILLLVYVGAVMTLFLFVVMMLSVEQEEKRSGFVRYFPFGLIVVLLLLSFLLYTSRPTFFGLIEKTDLTTTTPRISNLQALGNVLYTDYVYPFELAGVILLAAMIAAIALAHRSPRKRKIQNSIHQVTASPNHAVRLVNIHPKGK